jgi:hypothetical protein
MVLDDKTSEILQAVEVEVSSETGIIDCTEHAWVARE